MGKVTHDALWRLVSDAKITLLDGTEVDVRAVTVGDESKRKIERFARAAARSTYEAALDPSTSVYEENVAEIETMSRDELYGLIIESERIVVNRDAYAEIIPGSEEKRVETLGESIQDEIDTEKRDLEVAKTRSEWIATRLDDLRLELDDLDDDTLRDKARKVAASNVGTVAFSYAYQDATLFYGILLPSGERFFAEIPAEAPPSIKGQALAIYSEVDPYLFRRP